MDDLDIGHLDYALAQHVTIEYSAISSVHRRCIEDAKPESVCFNYSGERSTACHHDHAVCPLVLGCMK